MGRYMRECKSSREAMVEKTKQEIGAKMTRASTPHKRKFDQLVESEMTPSLVRLKTRLLAVVPQGNSVNIGSSTRDNCGSDRVLASCCPSNGSSLLANGSTDFVDLEEENEELLATSGGDLEKRETMPSSEIQCSELGELEYTTTPPNANFLRRSMVEKMPSEVELEEFFSAAESKLHKEFIDKYNYDIVKDEPLEGRYKWVPILVKP